MSRDRTSRPAGHDMDPMNPRGGSPDGCPDDRDHTENPGYPEDRTCPEDSMCPEGRGYPEERGYPEDPQACSGLPTRRDFLRTACAVAGSSVAAGIAGCKRSTGRGGRQKAGAEGRANAGDHAGGMAPARPREPRPGNAYPERDRVPPGEPRPRPSAVAGKGQVFAVLHEHTADAKGQPAAEPMRKVLDHLIRELTGKTRPLDGWASLFKAEDIVGIKPNAFAQTWCAPAVELIGAVIERLYAIGVPYHNILIWDHWNFAGSHVYRHFRRGPAVLKRQKEWGFDRTLYRLPTAGWTKFNRAITRATAVVNMPVFKDHDLAGVTCSMKNMTHGSTINPAHHHKNCCSPSIPEIYGLPMIRDKVRLIIVDGFRTIYQNGPFGARSRNFNVPHNTWFATTDPVAMDKIAWDTLDAIRTAKGMPVLMKRRHERGKPRGSGRPIHILKAGELGLGIADSSRIKIHKKKMG